MSVYKNVVQMSGLGIMTVILIVATLVEDKLLGVAGGIVGLYMMYGIPFIVSCKTKED